MAGTAVLGLSRELRTQPVRNRSRTSRRGQVEHKPVATSLASARPPQLAHSSRATSCRKLHRHLPAADVLAGISAALSVGAASADVVAVEARKAGDARRGGMPQPAQPRPAAPAVSSLPRRPLAALPGDTPPPPSVGRYDPLPTHRAGPPVPPPPTRGHEA